jgi:sorting nexin-13
VWPEGTHQHRQVLREDNTKMRTRMAAKLVLFALLSDDLKHVVGSETTRIGLLNFFTMLQNKKLNIRLILIILNNVLNVIYNTDDMVKHVA